MNGYSPIFIYERYNIILQILIHFNKHEEANTRIFNDYYLSNQVKNAMFIIKHIYSSIIKEPCKPCVITETFPSTCRNTQNISTQVLRQLERYN